MPLYMSSTLEKEISPALKKRMQGKTCFNFKTVPDGELIADLKKLTAVCAAAWDKQFRLSATSGEPIPAVNHLFGMVTRPGLRACTDCLDSAPKIG
jgi:hypothetical protein